jgi:hypothetical protein
MLFSSKNPVKITLSFKMLPINFFAIMYRFYSCQVSSKSSKLPSFELLKRSGKSLSMGPHAGKFGFDLLIGLLVKLVSFGLSLLG